MTKSSRDHYKVGKGKPPAHSRFKPGQSGNPNGRPRKKVTLAEAIERELNTRITVNEGGKQRRIRKVDAIAKQQTNKAAALLMKAIAPRESDPKDNLSPVLHEMRAIHAKHEVASQNATRVRSAAEVTVKVDDDHD